MGLKARPLLNKVLVPQVHNWDIDPLSKYDPKGLVPWDKAANSADLSSSKITKSKIDLTIFTTNKTLLPFLVLFSSFVFS